MVGVTAFLVGRSASDESLLQFGVWGEKAPHKTKRRRHANMGDFP